MKAHLGCLVPTLAVACLLVLPGCLFGSSTKISFRGEYINQQTFDQIRVGDSEELVAELFGEPTIKRERGDTEVWNYHYTQATTRSGAVLFLFATSSQTEYEGRVTVELQDAVVTRVTRAPGASR